MEPRVKVQVETYEKAALAGANQFYIWCDNPEKAMEAVSQLKGVISVEPFNSAAFSAIADPRYDVKELREAIYLALDNRRAIAA